MYNNDVSETIRVYEREDLHEEQYYYYSREPADGSQKHSSQCDTRRMACRRHDYSDVQRRSSCICPQSHARWKCRL